MAQTYWISFAIDQRDRHGRSHEDRHEALVRVISDVASTAVWHETPCFMIFDSGHEMDAINERLKSAMDAEFDLFVLVSAQTCDARIVGPCHDRDIFKLIANIEAG